MSTALYSARLFADDVFVGVVAGDGQGRGEILSFGFAPDKLIQHNRSRGERR
jgi:hypothetical protein